MLDVRREVCEAERDMGEVFEFVCDVVTFFDCETDSVVVGRGAIKPLNIPVLVPIGAANPSVNRSL